MRTDGNRRIIFAASSFWLQEIKTMKLVRLPASEKNLTSIYIHQLSPLCGPSTHSSLTHNEKAEVKYTIG